jgi:sigma-70-like protein
MTGGHHTHRTPTDQLHDMPDDQLLALWVGGHREGLDEFAARHHHWILRLVRQLSHGEHDPEVVVQDAWLDVIRSAAGFRGDGTVRAWLATIVRRWIGTTWRARDARPQTLTSSCPRTRPRPGRSRAAWCCEPTWRGCWPACPVISGRRSGGSTSSGSRSGGGEELADRASSPGGRIAGHARWKDQPRPGAAAVTAGLHRPGRDPHQAAASSAWPPPISQNPGGKARGALAVISDARPTPM